MISHEDVVQVLRKEAHVDGARGFRYRPLTVAEIAERLGLELTAEIEQAIVVALGTDGPEPVNTIMFDRFRRLNPTIFKIIYEHTTGLGYILTEYLNAAFDHAALDAVRFRTRAEAERQVLAAHADEVDVVFRELSSHL